MVLFRVLYTVVLIFPALDKNIVANNSIYDVLIVFLIKHVPSYNNEFVNVTCT